MVDIQGAGSVYTDPQLHSVAKKYGRADRGTLGIAKSDCLKIKLTQRRRESRESSEGSLVVKMEGGCVYFSKLQQDFALFILQLHVLD